MTAQTPGQTDDRPPALYARWCRVDTGPGTPDAVIASRWGTEFVEDREFWTSLDAELAAAREPQAVPGPHRHAFAATDCACDPSCDCWQRSLAPQPAPELAAALRATLDAVRRICERPGEYAGRSQGVVVNGERLAARILAVIENLDGR